MKDSDFLAPEYGGSGRKHRHQRVQDLLAHKARGSDLVFTHFVELDISGHLPNRAEHRERIKIANPASCFVMKAITFGSRRSEKDAYDLYILCDALGVQAMIEQLRPIKNNGLTQEAISALRETFDSPNALGPYSISDFFKALDEDAERLRRRAFELIQAILDSIEVDSR